MNLNFKRFLESWHVNLQGAKTAGELVDYAEMFDIELDGATTRAKQTALGKMINAHVGQVVEFNGHRMIIQVRLLEGKKRYEVHRAEAS